MRLIVLGAGPSYTDVPGGIGSAYLVEHAGHAVLLDLGHGSFSGLASAWEPSALDAVVISHLHPDHFIDLVALRHYLRYEFDPPRRVRVLGPAGLAGRLDALHAETGFSAATLDIEAIGGPSTRTIGPFTLQAGLVTHTVESYGFRVSTGAGPGLIYSGDCGRAGDLANLVRPGDTLLSEVSFGPGPVPAGAFHLDAPAVGSLASATAAGQVLLTHIHMGLDRDATVAAVKAHFGGPAQLVSPGDSFEV